MITPNLYTAAKRRRMSLADEDERDFEPFGAEVGSASKVDVVSLLSFYSLAIWLFRCLEWRMSCWFGD